jgi:signal transduction histidine kinase
MSPLVNPKSRVWLLRTIFLLIIAGFALGNFVVFLSARGVQAANHRLGENAIVSVEQVCRIARDVDQERLLIDAHIFLTETSEMPPIEREITEVDHDLDTAARIYEPLTTFQGEHETWVMLRDEIGEIRQPVQEILNLSRSNRDTEAIAGMERLRSRFDAIHQKADQLISINTATASGAVTEIETLQRRSLAQLRGITLSGTLLSLFAAGWVTRLIRRRDEQIAADALALEANNRELDAFAGRVAHDLRGPLSAIGLAAAKLRAYAPEGDTPAEVLRRNIARMDAMIRDLLMLSRINAEVLAGVAHTTTAVLSIEEELLPKVRSVNGVLRVDLEPAELYCNETFLRQMLWNLGQNAVKYRRSEVPLEIDIRGRRFAHRYELRVSDNGSGMSPEDVRHAFEPFFRSPRVRATPGTGLGLSIVKRVVEASGGTVSINSEVNKGTTFVIHLPLSNGAAAA